MNQKWRKDPKLYNAKTKVENNQIKKELDYDTTYRKEFLECDPLRDWESFDRCVWLWNWAINQINENIDKSWSVLDAGTKDAQFPAWLRNQDIMAVGLEYSQKYVRYGLNKGRPVQYGDVCNMEFDDNSFDIVTSHHLLGLVEDNYIAISEMFRVCSKYLYTLCTIPGNPRKHFSLMKDSSVFNKFIKDNKDKCEVVYNGYLETGFANEWTMMLKKKGE